MASIKWFCCFSILLASAFTIIGNSDQQYLLNTLFTCVLSSQEYAPQLQELIKESNSCARTANTISYSYELPLYAAYPGLVNALPHITLGDLPTPVLHARQLEKELEIGQLYIKCDDVTGALHTDDTRAYGGNKVRKLEFLIADALHHGAQTLLTFGCVGSNHATATASCAQQCGLRSISMLKPQPPTHVVRKNLLLMDYFGSHIVVSAHNAERARNTIAAFVNNVHTEGDFPYVIPTGGDNALGSIGFVNAAFELKKQIEEGLLPEPDYIYVAATGCFHGTVAGLAIGLNVAGLKSVIVPICIEPENAHEFERNARTLIAEINHLLHTHDASFPLIDVNAIELPIIYDCCGSDYGIYTHEAVEAMRLFKATELVVLDGTYTGKAAAALVRDARNGTLKNKTVLFWNTYCALDFAEQLKDRDYKTLPEAVHRYFEHDVQELDR